MGGSNKLEAQRVASRRNKVTMQLSRKKVFMILWVTLFLVSFLLTRSFPSILPEKTIPPNNITLDQRKNTISSLKKEIPAESVIFFWKKLQRARSIDELEHLFIDTFYQSNQEFWLERRMKISVAKKWGEIAPLSGLEKLESSPDGKEFIPVLFSSWTAKDPESAISCYEESYKKSDHSSLILTAIIGEYALLSPEKALLWLSSQENDFSKEELREAHKRFLSAISRTHPEMIPEMVEIFSSSTDQISTFTDMGDHLYSLGMSWGMYNTESREWVEKLPPGIRAKAEAGRIIGITNSDIGKFNDQISQLPLEEQLDTTRELAHNLKNQWKTKLDMPAYINWVMDSLPETEVMQNEFSSIIKSWILNNRTESGDWIDSQPLGKNKELLQRWFGERRRDASGSYME